MSYPRAGMSAVNARTADKSIGKAETTAFIRRDSKILM